MSQGKGSGEKATVPVHVALVDLPPKPRGTVGFYPSTGQGVGVGLEHSGRQIQWGKERAGTWEG